MSSPSWGTGIVWRTGRPASPPRSTPRRDPRDRAALPRRPAHHAHARHRLPPRRARPAPRAGLPRGLPLGRRPRAHCSTTSAASSRCCSTRASHRRPSPPSWPGRTTLPGDRTVPPRPPAPARSPPPSWPSWPPRRCGPRTRERRSARSRCAPVPCPWTSPVTRTMRSPSGARAGTPPASSFATSIPP